MPVVPVDDDVWGWLKSHATPFEDTPNSVLRRLAGLDSAAAASSSAKANTQRKRASRDVAKSAARSSGDYVVTKQPDRHKHWWFQIYQRKLTQKARRGDFSIVVVCD